MFGGTERTCGVEWSIGVHEKHRRRDVCTLTLSSKDDIALVVRAT